MLACVHTWMLHQGVFVCTHARMNTLGNTRAHTHTKNTQMYAKTGQTHERIRHHLNPRQES